MNAERSTLAESIGMRLRERRHALMVSQQALAELAGISVHTLSNVESGRGNPSIQILDRLLDCLGLELSVQPRMSGIAAPEVSQRSEP